MMAACSTDISLNANRGVQRGMRVLSGQLCRRGDDRGLHGFDALKATRRSQAGPWHTSAAVQDQNCSGRGGAASPTCRVEAPTRDLTSASIACGPSAAHPAGRLCRRHHRHPASRALQTVLTRPRQARPAGSDWLQRRSGVDSRLIHRRPRPPIPGWIKNAKHLGSARWS